MFGYVKKTLHESVVAQRDQAEASELYYKQRSDAVAGELAALKETLSNERRRAGIKITELNETIEDRDQQLRHAYRQIAKRGMNGRFEKRDEA